MNLPGGNVVPGAYILPASRAIAALLVKVRADHNRVAGNVLQVCKLTTDISPDKLQFVASILPEQFRPWWQTESLLEDVLRLTKEHPDILTSGAAP